mgnify:CR=1 FL=1
MKNITVLGSGCTKCKKTAEIIESIARELSVEVSVTKETSPQVIMSFGVMSTPAVVVDNNLVHSGSIPLREQIINWLE